MYKQLIAFNQASAGHQTGYCLANVRKGFGIASKYGTALEAWNHTQQHKDRSMPGGVAVPLYYTYKSDGHINVQLPGGKVWSDGTVYASLDAYLSSHPAVKYLGWGESINGVNVLHWVDDPKPSLPPVGSRIQLVAPQTRTTWRVGTAQQAGTIKVTDNTFVYIVRGYDSKYPGRIIINSASAGGDGVGLALYYLNGSRVDGWKQL